MSVYLKDPQSRIDYAIQWSGGYLDGQVISASSWSVAPDAEDGVAVEASAFDLGRTSVTLSGGRPGDVYRVTNRVVLSDGQSDERSLTLRVEQR